MKSEIERFVRGEPIAVEVGEIERALGALWQQASAAGDAQTTAVSRAALWNVISRHAAAGPSRSRSRSWTKWPLPCPPAR